MAYEQTVAIRNNIAITSSGWTDLGGNAGGSYPLPISCNYIVIINTAAVPIVLATDPTNANSTVDIPAGASYGLGITSWGPPMLGTPSGCRFRLGTANAACSLQSTSGSINVTAEFCV
jgi:hypothetical protein